MRLKIQHTTKYRYPGAVSNNHNEVRLMPLTEPLQLCTEFWLTTTPFCNVFYYNLPTGRVHHFNIRGPHKELSITGTLTVITQPSDPFSQLTLGEDDTAFYSDVNVHQDYAEYLSPTARVPMDIDVSAFLSMAREEATGPSAAEFLLSVNRVLHRTLTYDPGSTEVDTPLAEVVARRHGVCQDYTHLMLAIARTAGIPSRYVSGYLYTKPGLKQGRDTISPSGSITEVGEDGLVDGEAMHAWVDCLLPDGRWLGLDPTNCLLTTENYIRVHTGRDYSDVPPVRGIYSGPDAKELDVTVTIVEE